MVQSALVIQNLIGERKEEFTELCIQHYVKTLYVFGSVLSDSFSTESDIDFLYKFDLEKFKNWDKADYDYIDNLFSFEQALTNFFNRKIDLVPDVIITNQYLKQEVEKTKHQIYAA